MEGAETCLTKAYAFSFNIFFVFIYFLLQKTWLTISVIVVSSFDCIWELFQLKSCGCLHVNILD